MRKTPRDDLSTDRVAVVQLQPCPDVHFALKFSISSGE